MVGSILEMEAIYYPVAIPIRSRRLAFVLVEIPIYSCPPEEAMTPEELYGYASRFELRAIKAGRGSEWPTFRQVAKRFGVTYDDIEEAASGDVGGRYLGIAVAVGISEVGYREFDCRGDWLVEAYQ